MENEVIWRLAAFLGLFALFAALEALLPRRARALPLLRRWSTNWGMVLLANGLLRLMALALPLLAIGAALDAAARGWGLFNLLGWSLWVTIPLSVVIFDFLIWLQHLLTHRIPVLWRLHRVHHADRDLDVTTAIRFHPLETGLSMLYRIGLVYLLGPPAVAILVFEVLLNGTAMFNHANLRLPEKLDRAVRLVLVTPDMHRVHHSVHRDEHDTNFGFALSIWDRLFGTYRPQPRKGHETMELGLEWRDDAPARLGWSLVLPLRKL